MTVGKGLTEKACFRHGLQEVRDSTRRGEVLRQGTKEGERTPRSTGSREVEVGEARAR